MRPREVRLCVSPPENDDAGGRDRA
jgi:hypothetical protein